MSNLHYKRILLKLSGEVLSGKEKFGIDYSIVSSLANQIKVIHKKKIEVGMSLVVEIFLEEFHLKMKEWIEFQVII